MEQFVITFDEIRALLVEQQYAEKDIEELEKAFEFAKKLHAGQYRVSEEPYYLNLSGMLSLEIKSSNVSLYTIISECELFTSTIAGFSTRL